MEPKDLKRAMLLLAALCAACMLLGAGFGAYLFACDQDEYGADHVFFKAHECFQPKGADGSVFLECRRVVKVGGQ